MRFVAILFLLSLCWAVLGSPPSPSFAAEPVMKIFKIGYMDVKEAEALVRPFLSERDRLTSHTGTNTLAIKDFPSNIASIEELLARTDVRPKNVRIKVWFVDGEELQRVGLKVKWSYKDGNWSMGNFLAAGGGGGGDGLDVRAVVGQRTEKVRKRGQQNVLVMTGRRGRIGVGTHMPYRDWFFAYSRDQGYYASTLNFKRVNTGFSVEPRVSGETITLVIAPEVSYLAGQDGGTIVYRRLATTIEVEEGEPVVLGGSSDNTESVVTRIIGGFEKKEKKSEFYMILIATLEDKKGFD